MLIRIDPPDEQMSIGLLEFTDRDYGRDLEEINKEIDYYTERRNYLQKRKKEVQIVLQQKKKFAVLMKAIAPNQTLTSKLSSAIFPDEAIVDF